MPEHALHVTEGTQSVTAHKVRLDASRLNYRVDERALVDETKLALGKIGKDDRECMQRRRILRAQMTRHADDRRRIQSATQRRADGLCRAKPRAHRLAEDLAKGIGVLV